MAEKVGGEQENVDDVSRLQRKVDDLGVMFYAYVGIIQRDAPPSERGPEEAEEVVNDQKVRQELKEKTPGYAKSIVQTSMEIERIIGDLEMKMKTYNGKERQLLDTADFQSRQAGEEMIQTVDTANKLLSNIRQVIATREDE